jgi:hypothetical protein
MTDINAAIAAGAVAAGGALSAWAGTGASAFGVPASAVIAAATGAVVPLLLLDPEPLMHALRHWLGAIALALCTASLAMHFGGLDKSLAGPVAGVIAAFSRDLFSAARGQIPPLVAALRERLAGKPKE